MDAIERVIEPSIQSLEQKRDEILAVLKIAEQKREKLSQMISEKRGAIGVLRALVSISTPQQFQNPQAQFQSLQALQAQFQNPQAQFQSSQFQNPQLQNPQAQFQNPQLQTPQLQNTQFQNPQAQFQTPQAAQAEEVPSSSKKFYQMFSGPSAEMNR